MPNKQNEKKKGKAKGKENVQVYFILFQNYLMSNCWKIIKTFCCFLVQIQEAAKFETKPVKMEKKKTKFVNILSQGDIFLKGIHIIINLYK